MEKFPNDEEFEDQQEQESVAEREKRDLESLKKEAFEILNTYRAIISQMDPQEIKTVFVGGFVAHVKGEFEYKEKPKEQSAEGNKSEKATAIPSWKQAPEFETITKGVSVSFSESGYYPKHEVEPGKWIGENRFHRQVDPFDKSNEEAQQNIQRTLKELHEAGAIGFAEKEFRRDPDDERKVGFLSMNNPLVLEFIEAYQDVLQKILELKNRQLGAERQMKLLENLENRRRTLHDKAATDLRQDFAKGRLSKYGNKHYISHKDTKMLLALAYEMYHNLKFDNEMGLPINPYLEPEKMHLVEEVRKRIKEKLGLDSEVGVNIGRYGWHAVDDSDSEQVQAHNDELESEANSTLKIKFPQGDLLKLPAVWKIIREVFKEE